jgi:hypothetical protein
MADVDADSASLGTDSDGARGTVQLGPNLTGSPDWHELIGDLIKARQAMPPLLKSETAEVPTKSGKYSYHYADLSAVLDGALPSLREANLTLIQAPDFNDQTLLLTTVIANAGGSWISNTFRIPCGGRDPQAVGSAITYARRYGLMALLALAGEDDDGKAAMPQTAKEQAKKAANDATNGALKKGSDLLPPNPAKKQLLAILKDQVKCPKARGVELFDAVTAGQFLPKDIDDPEKAKAILDLFEREAKNIPYERWLAEIDELKLAAGGNAVDDFAKEAL